MIENSQFLLVDVSTVVQDNYERFKNLTYEGFRQLAKDDSLSAYEKIGFPNTYRKGKEAIIFRDIESKLTNLQKKGRIVMDIGPGCSEIPRMMIDLCQRNGHTLLLVDSTEMLNLIPDAPFVSKIAGRFPQDCVSIIQEYRSRVHSILTYSVLHYIFSESNVFDFLDHCLSLLDDEGELLIGDIPNISKRKRFFSSTNGVRFHKEFMGTEDAPPVFFNKPECGEIDDAVILSLLLRARIAGFDAYVLPQAEDVPMTNRREDILIRRP